MSDFYSGWLAPPNGFAKYRLHLIVNVASQDVNANTTTLNWATVLEKDRSQNGFYGYTAAWSTTVNGTMVMDQTGRQPASAWTGWTNWPLGSGSIVVPHNADGTKTGLAVAGAYVGQNTGWAIGTVALVGALTMDLPAIPRATIPTVSPSPAAAGATVTIDLPRAVGSFTHDITWVAGTLSGTVATGAGATQAWTVPSVMGEFPGLATGPIVLTVVTKSGATVIGSKQVTLLARNPPAVPVPKAPGSAGVGQFDVRARLVKFSGTDWSARQQLPANTVQLVAPLSATATCSISLSKLNAVDFTDYSIVDIDVFNGTDWVFTNHRFVLSRSDDDGVDATKTGSYTGTEFIDYQLARAYVPGDYVWDGTPNHANPTTPGEMLRYAIADAKTRGWGPRFEIAFDGSKTSLGEPWANTAVSRTFSKGTPLSQMLSGLVDDGLVEYRTEYRNNKAWLVLLNPGTGSDYSANGADPVVNFALAQLSRAPRRATMEGRLTSVTVAGDESSQITRTKAPFDADVYGRLEGWVSASGLKTADALNVIGDNALRDNSTSSSEKTFEYTAQAAFSQFQPFAIFRPGDWVLIPDGDNVLKDRIGQITVSKTADSSLTLTVLTGDRILSGTASLAKRQSAQTGGSINGGNGSTPTPLDSRIPSGPVISTVTSAGYWDTDGAAKSAVTLTWAAVLLALSGSAITVDIYEIWWRPTGVDASWALRGSTNQLTITLGGWDVLTGIDLRLRARSTAGIFGEFSADQAPYTTLAPAVDLAGPVISNLYTDGIGTIYVVWGGLLGASLAPVRMKYVAGEISTDGGTTYTTMGTPITAAGTVMMTPGTWGDFSVRLRPYDRLGNPGTSSSPQTITLIDPHIASPIPAVPTALAATAGIAWSATGFLPEAWFTLTWTAPTLDINGNAVEIAGYDIFGLKSTETIERYLTSSTTNSVRIPVGSGETWSFRIRANSKYGGVSARTVAIVATANATIAGTPAPTAPTMSQYAGLLRIVWAGGGMAPQIKYVYGMISTTAGGTYTRVGTPLVGAGEIIVPGLAPGPYYAKIVMVDELGNSVTSVASALLTLLPITGVTIQTSPLANTGIKITTSSLTSYDVSGNPTFILDANTGAVTIAAYTAVFNLGAQGTIATTGAPTTGVSISSQNSSFNTFIHPSGVEIRNDQTPLSWWEADALDASLVNFFSPRAVIGQRMRVGDYEFLKEMKTTGTKLVIRYKGA